MDNRRFNSRSASHILNHRKQRLHSAVVNASRTVAEMLEPRRLLSGITPAQLQAAVRPGVTAILTKSGAAELSVTPSTAGSAVYTPDFVQLDADPQLSKTGQLEPFTTPGPTGLLPAVVRHAYGVDQITFGSVQGDGTGQTIAIIDAYDYPTASTDLHAFDVAAGLPDPPSLTRVNQTGGTTLPGDDPAGKDNSDWEMEEALDVEWSHAMAPGASIVLVEANSANTSDILNAAVGYARSASGVVAVTMSFGGLEDSTVTSLDSLFTTPSGHAGVTFLASTGDDGAPGYYPALSPNVVAVGGTTLNTNSSGGYLSETGWSLSGGGISTVEPQPSYQSGVVTQSTTARTTPDVSFDADPNTGVAIDDTYDFGTSNPWEVVGGTSVASPSWAGLIAVADQGRSLSGGSSLDGFGKTLPKLYSVAASNFHDITSGNNGYAAGPGYDLVTGRGTPVANTLIPLLSAAGPFVTGAAPTGIQSADPSSVTFDFSAAMNTSSFSVAADVDSFTGPHSANMLSSITGFSWVNSTTLQVNFTPLTAQGPYTVVIGPQILSATGGAMDQNQNGVTGEVPGDEYSVSFNYDNNPLAVSSTTPGNGGIIDAPSSVLSVTFNQPIDPSTVNISNLTLSQGTVSAVNVLAGDTTVQYTVSGLLYEGTLTASIAAGALNDANGNPLLTAYSGSFGIDVVSVPLPTPFTSAAPGGSLIYTDAGVSGGIQFLGDTDSYTVNLNANQTISVTVTGSQTLQPTVQVTDPNSNFLGSASAVAAGDKVMLQTIAAQTAGIYTITLSGANNTTGSYTIGATLNAAINTDNFGGVSHQTLVNAQDITGSFLSLGGGATRGAVMGAPLPASASLSDYYAFPLTAGDSVSLTISAATAGSDTISLLNGSGGVLTSGSAGASNVDQSISNFIAPTTATYYALVSANSNATSYDLVVVRNAVLSLQPHNNFSAAQSLGTTEGALGDISSTSTADWYSVNVSSTGNVLAFSTATPGEGGGQFANTLDPHLQIYDPNDNLAATGTKLTDGSNESISYQPLMTGTYRVEVTSQNSTAGEYFLKAGNTLELNLPANVTKGQGVVNGTLGASNAPASNLTVTLTSSDPSRISVPTSIVLPAGQTSVTLPLTVLDDHMLNGPEAVTITALGGTYFSTSEIVISHDNETAVLSVSLPTTGYKNGGTVTGMITSSATPTSNITVALASNLINGLTVPATVTLLAGHTTATFTATIVQNNTITGTEAVTVSASVENWTTGSATINIIDTDETIAVGLPASGWEGQTLTTDTITLGGTTPTALVVNLSSSNTSELTVPATVTVPAGQSSVSFNVTLLNIGTGSHTAMVTATAAGFNSGSASVVIHDSNLNHLSFNPVSSPHVAGTPFTAAVSAYNIENELIAVYNGTGTLTAAGSSGSFAVTPSSVTFASGIWTGSVTLTVADAAAVLTVTTGGVSISSNSFVVLGGAVSSLAWGSVGATEVANVPFAETITATDAYGNVASSFNGSVNLTGVIGATNTKTLMGTNPFTGESTGDWTFGYYFTLSSNYLVTAVRSYFGDDVSIFDTNGNLLYDQPVSATAGTWTNTSLAAPLQLYSGNRYFLTCYSNNGPYYYANTKPTKPSFASFGTAWYSGGDAWPVFSYPSQPAIDLSGFTGSATTSVAISPTTATFTNGVWTGNITVPQVETGMHLHADDGLGQTADTTNFNVIAGAPAAPSTPALSSASDTGVSNSDGITNLNNSAGKTLTFTIGNTVSGATVTLFANGVAIGSAVASGTSTSVTTNGTTILADGSVSFTAQQAINGYTSTASPADPIAIDTKAPTAALATVTPVPYTPVNSDSLTFSEPIAGLAIGDLSLTRNGGANLLTGNETLTSSNNINWTIGNLSTCTTATGNYVLSLVPGAISDVAGNALAASTSTSWSYVAAGPLMLDGSAGNTSFYLELDATGSSLQVWQEPYSNSSRPTAPVGTPTATYAVNSLTSITVSGAGSGDVSLIIDQTNGLIQPAGGIAFTGGTNATGDLLTVLLPASGATVSVNATTVTTGSSVVTYSNLSAITIDGTSGNDAVIQTAQPAATLSFNGGTGNDTLTINSGFFTFAGDPSLTTASLTLNDNSTVDLIASSNTGIQTLSFAQINIGSGGSATVANASTHAHRALLITNGLSIAPTGKLDLGSNDLLIHAGNLQTLTSELASGFNNGTWTGTGISSTAAALDTSHLTALGILLNSNGAGNPLYSSAPGSLGLFDGQSPLASDILIKYTFYGDANLDGKVDGSDYTRIDSGYLTHATAWSNGDFNYDGFTNGSDYSLIDNAFNTQGASLSAEISASDIISTNAPRRAPNFAPNLFGAGTPMSIAISDDDSIERSSKKKDLLDGLLASS
jgi:subtilase family serine protease